MVPVIVNAVLSDHQIIVDIVAFVGPGDFPRSRLAEKQRGKILASWVTRKLRTIAQFGIRDPDGDASFMDHISHRHSTMLGRANSQDPRSSMAPSDQPSPAPAPRDDILSHRSSIMPETPLNLPSAHPQTHPQVANDYQLLSLQQNGYHIDTTGIFDRRSSNTNPNPNHILASSDREPQAATAETPIVALNDLPYALRTESNNSYELATDYHENNAYQNGDDKLFDPNADPERPYGDYTPDGSTEDLHMLGENGRPRLSLANPDSYGVSESNSNSKTPTTATNIATPTSAYPASGNGHMGLLTQEQREAFAEESPYEVRGNPFVEPIPNGAGMPAFDIPVRQRQWYAPVAQSQHVRNESPVTTARALLPSQMRNVNVNAHAMPSNLPLSNPAYANLGYDSMRQEIQRKPSHLERQQEIQERLQPGDPRASMDTQSVVGSVRRRYDGIAYGEWEYWFCRLSFEAIPMLSW